ncbi:MAG: hypothetical protein ACLFOY_11070 [Desulfatibacillaceae bacterium]
MEEYHEEVEQGERMVLDHEPVPGYRTALYVAIGVGVVWLIVSFAGVFHHGA